MNIIYKIPGTILGLLFLSACSGGGGNSGSSPTDLQSSNFGLLKPVESAEELADSIHRGLQGAAYVSDSFEILPVAAEGGEDLGLDAGGRGNFSTTNLQELGVDEADIVKYDGSILYVLDTVHEEFIGLEDDFSELGLSFASQPRQRIRLFETQPDIPSVEQKSEIELSLEVYGSGDFSVEGLYLVDASEGRQLLSVGQSNPFLAWVYFSSDFHWRDNETRVQAWDVDDAQNPTRAWSLVLDGNLLSSRRIGNLLYLVTRYSPDIEGVTPYPQTEGELEANREKIEDTALSAMLPRITRNDGTSEALLAPSDCYVPNPAFEGNGVLPSGGSLITVTVLDLEAPGQQVQSLCLNAWSSGFYASSEALYITANSQANSTLIHKIALTDSGPEYRGSGEVPGYLGTGNPAFLMSEHNGDLRVVSSKWGFDVVPLPVPELTEDETDDEANEPVDDGHGRHRLSVLRESADGSQLELISQLPNDERSAHIGKPGEDVYAARFLGERAYIVTFEVTDPLYVLDISNAEDPLIAGELEIPGFSTLLQPVGENLLLGVGQDVPVGELNLTQGVKVALFDVADITAPVSLGEIVIGKRGSYSPALNDHHALTLLKHGEGYRVALPIERNEAVMEGQDDSDDPWFWYGWTDSGLYLFDVEPATGTLSLSGTLITAESSEEQPYSQSWLYNFRSVIHDNAVFFVHDGEISAQHWSE